MRKKSVFLPASNLIFHPLVRVADVKKSHSVDASNLSLKLVLQFAALAQQQVALFFTSTTMHNWYSKLHQTAHQATSHMLAWINLNALR